MGESRGNLPGTSEVVDIQYGISADRILRRRLYDVADIPMDIQSLTYDKIGIPGDATVVDIGCLDGADLFKLAERGHTGPLIGIDRIHSAVADARAHQKRAGVSNVSFLAGNAQALPLPDESADVVQALFMLYHVDNSASALDEANRVLKHNGLLVVGTTGSGHRALHRQIEAEIAVQLGKIDKQKYVPPPKFAEPFMIERAENLIGDRFRIVGTIEHGSSIQYQYGGINYQELLDSLLSMKNTFSPMPSGESWEQAVDKANRLILGVSEDESEPNPIKVDYLERAVIVAKKD